MKELSNALLISDVKWEYIMKLR